ncbi:hypothetical protein [Umezawaea beigongshangensis]|uniref:hypothetical protein n=1 Tax=Umezawaea beigongshangensis TaxID=2780383 RepID=UPI0018F25CF8|nr:hypothetical protein [Umezawaea beigongshangensis]
MSTGTERDEAGGTATGRAVRRSGDSWRPGPPDASFACGYLVLAGVWVLLGFLEWWFYFVVAAASLVLGGAHALRLRAGTRGDREAPRG